MLETIDKISLHRLRRHTVRPYHFRVNKYRLLLNVLISLHNIIPHNAIYSAIPCLVLEIHNTIYRYFEMDPDFYFYKLTFYLLKWLSGITLFHLVCNMNTHLMHILKTQRKIWLNYANILHLHRVTCPIQCITDSISNRSFLKEPEAWHGIFSSVNKTTYAIS